MKLSEMHILHPGNYKKRTLFVIVDVGVVAVDTDVYTMCT